MHTENYYISRIEKLQTLNSKYWNIAEMQKEQIESYIRNYQAKSNARDHASAVSYDLYKYVCGTMTREDFYNKHNFLEANPTAYIAIKQYKAAYQLYLRKNVVINELKKEYMKEYPNQTKYRIQEIKPLEDEALEDD